MSELSINSALATAGLIFALLAAALHVFIFYLEAFAWEGEQARGIFGNTPEQARDTKFMALNQGFYNLLLAVEAILGALLGWLASGTLAGVGLALALFGTGSMLAAALLLFFTSKAHRGAAIKQGTLPCFAVVLMLIALVA